MSCNLCLKNDKASLPETIKKTKGGEKFRLIVQQNPNLTFDNRRAQRKCFCGPVVAAIKIYLFGKKKWKKSKLKNSQSCRYLWEDTLLLFLPIFLIIICKFWQLDTYIRKKIPVRGGIWIYNPPRDLVRWSMLDARCSMLHWFTRDSMVNEDVD